MQFFDIVALKEEVDLKALGRRLGYKKIFALGKEMELCADANHPGEGKALIVKSGDEAVLVKALRNNSVIGIILDNNKASGRFIEDLRIHEKLLLIPVGPLVCPDRGDVIHSLYRAKSVLRSALMGRASVALVTLAKEKECMLSCSQMLEMAKLIGANDNVAKEMLSVLGSFV